MNAAPTSTPPSAPAPAPAAGADRPIVFFDGVCGLCNRTVDFLLRHDRNGDLIFAPLQGETARNLLPAEAVEHLDTLVLREPDGATHVRSAAAVRILRRLGGGWKLAAALLWLIPLPLRNLGYRGVAAGRYKVFGQLETCRMPTDAERQRFLP